ncbi:MAG: alpha/beta hydrolase [Acidobacteriota bacterium]
MEHLHQGNLGIRQVLREAPRATLLWIHGLGESGLGFEELMASPRLAGYSHRAPDLAGYGRSAWASGAVGLREHVEIVLRDAENLPSPVILVGHSMGGVIGQWAVAAAPQRFAAFVNVEGNISLEDCGFSRRIAEYEREAFLGAGFHRLLASIYRAGVKDLPLAGYYASMRLCDPRTLYLNSEELVSCSGAQTLAMELAALEVPTIYLYGNPRGTGAHSRSLLDVAGVPWKGIDAAGHWPFLDQPEAFLDELVAFLDTLELASSALP